MPGPNKHLINLTGKRFDHLKVLNRAPNTGNGSATWKCQCDCGNKTAVTGTNLRAGHVTTCGHNCIYVESPGRFQPIHGYARTKLYATYNQMMQRCYNPKHKSYMDYGTRGITIYSEWIKDFTKFRRYILKHLGKRPEGMTLDRIDNNKGYFPGNLRWTTHKQQIDNQRRHNQYTKFIDDLYEKFRAEHRNS